MNFFEQQDRARKHTKRLIFLFVVAVICIIIAVDLLILAVFGYSQNQVSNETIGPAWLKDQTGLLVKSSLVVLAAIVCAMLYKITTLASGGGGAVARAMGGTLVPGDVTTPKRKQLRNVVEEIAIASGVSVPEIYVLEKESGINAFAAGYTPGDAAVAVSRGALETLTRAELQGVIAHEFSHIFNGDMRLNIRLMGALFGIFMIALVGRQIISSTRYSRSSRKEGGGIVMVGVGLLVIGSIGLFFGRLIQSAVSRQREYLADASAVQFTREPEGIGGALKKIAAHSQHGTLEAADAQEVSHMLFASGLNSMFATHPPIIERIRKVLPAFQPSELKLIATQMQSNPPPLESEPQKEQKRESRFPTDIIFGQQNLAAGMVAADQAGHSGQQPSPPVQPAVAHADIDADQVGTLTWDHVDYAEDLIGSLPETLVSQAHSVHQAVSLVLALLIDTDPSTRRRQLEMVASATTEHRALQVSALMPQIDALMPLQRLPLIEIACPTLKRRPARELQVTLGLIARLIRIDGKVTVFEFALSKLITAYLNESMYPARSARRQSGLTLYQVKKDVAVLMAVIAGLGHSEDEAILPAYHHGFTEIYANDVIPYQFPEYWVKSLEEALDRIDRLDVVYKEAVIDGMLRCVRHDHNISLEEVELIRAICAAIHCPMPPSITI